MPIGPVSELYQSPHPYKLVDVPVNDHFEAWGYSLADEVVDAEGQGASVWHSTAVYRIHEGGQTPLVYVTKPAHTATFDVEVLDGEVQMIRALASGAVENPKLKPGDKTVIRPGQAYLYVNIGDSDSLLHDTARPSFQDGDEVELTSSLLDDSLLTMARTMRRDAGSYCIAKTLEGQLRLLNLPNKFFDLAGQAIAGR